MLNEGQNPPHQHVGLETVCGFSLSQQKVVIQAGLTRDSLRAGAVGGQGEERVGRRAVSRRLSGRTVVLT